MSYSKECRRKGKTLELTPHAPPGRKFRWKTTKLRGKSDYFKYPDTRDGYEQALAEFHRRRQDTANRLAVLAVANEMAREVAPGDTEDHELVEKFRAFAEAEESVPVDEAARRVFRGFCIDYRERLVAWRNEISAKIDDLDRRAHEAGVGPLVDPEAPEVDPLLVDVVEAYRADLDARRATDDLKPSTVRTNRTNTAPLEKFATTTGIRLSQVTNETHSEFKVWMKTNLKANSESLRTYRKRAADVLKFAAGRYRSFAVPADWIDKKNHFGSSDKAAKNRIETKAELWTPEEFRKALDGLDPLWRAMLLCRLNFGMRDVDLGELEKDELRDGRCVFAREKRASDPNAPVINYLMWPETAAAIEEAGSTHQRLALLTVKGLPITKEDGQSRVNQQWGDKPKQPGLRTKLGLKGKTLDKLRATGGTFVKRYRDHHDVKLDIFQLYLGHKPQGVGDKHYGYTDGEQCRALDDALSAMRQHFLV